MPSWYVFMGEEMKVQRVLEMDLLGPFVYPGYMVSKRDKEATLQEMQEGIVHIKHVCCKGSECDQG